MGIIMKDIRIIDLVHLFIYLMIYIILSNWFINFMFVVLNAIVMFVYYFYCIRIIHQKRKENKIKKDDK